MNLCTNLVLHLEQANNRELSREMIWREKSLDGKESSAAIAKTISNHHGDEVFCIIIIIQTHFICFGFYEKSRRSKRAYKRCFSLFCFCFSPPDFNPLSSLSIPLTSVCHIITLLPMLYLLDVFIYLTFYTTHNILILWKPTTSINRKLLHKYTQINLLYSSYYCFWLKSMDMILLCFKHQLIKSNVFIWLPQVLVVAVGFINAYAGSFPGSTQGLQLQCAGLQLCAELLVLQCMRNLSYPTRFNP